MLRTCRTICLVLAMTADATKMMRRAYQESSFNLEMQSIARSHDKETVSVDPQGDLELFGTSGSKQKVDFAVTKKDEAAEEDSDASPSCHLRNTDFSNIGISRVPNFPNGRTYYLDRHTVDCGVLHVMKQWNLQRDGNDVSIHYECCEVPGGVERIPEKKKTTIPARALPTSEESLAGLVSLNEVDCGNDLLQKWKVKRDPLVIEYWCAKPKFARVSGLLNIDGPAKNDGPGAGWPMFLDRHNVECPAARPYLSKWDIRRTDGKPDAHIKMVYGCVIAGTPAPTPDGVWLRDR